MPSSNEATRSAVDPHAGKKAASLSSVEECAGSRITQAIVRDILDYDPETGDLIWRVRDGKYFASARYHDLWNKRYPGTRALRSKDKFKGYRYGTIFSQTYLAHRIIWLWMTGDWPTQVDHKNHVRADNRWSNLRSVTNKENSRNQKMKSNNTSGVTGVCWCKNTQAWQARIKVDYKFISLGFYANIDDAANVRRAAELRYGFYKNHGKAA